MERLSQKKIAEMAFELLVHLCKERTKEKDPKTKTRLFEETQNLVGVAFDSLESCVTRRKKKRSGGYRIITAPPAELKQVLRKLVLILYRLQKRGEYYDKNPQDVRKVEYRDGCKNHIHPSLHGGLQNKSIATTARVHTQTDACFLIELDLKNAFPSVTRASVLEILNKIITTECKTYFYTYKGQRGKNRKRLGGHFNPNYVRLPLFNNRDCKEFRIFIRKQALQYESFEDTQIGEVVATIAHQIANLVTHKGFLPQGFPTSNMILNLILSENILPFLKLDFHYKLSIYVDNIFISTNTKPTSEMIEKISAVFERDGLFTINKQKTSVFDLRNQAGHILGMKLVRRTANQENLERMRSYNYTTRAAVHGFKKRDTENKPWKVTHLSLSQKTQKTYRALLHRTMNETVDEETLAKANGYIGHLVSIYGWPACLMPSCLRQVVDTFRKKYNLYKE